jgi:hypothetical protein
MRTVVSTIITFIWHSYYNRNHSKRTSFLCLYVTYKWKTVTCVQCWPVGHCVWDDSQHRPSHSSRLVFLHECTAPAQNYRHVKKGGSFTNTISDFLSTWWLCDTGWMIPSRLLYGPLSNAFNEKGKQLWTLKGNGHAHLKFLLSEADWRRLNNASTRKLGSFADILIRYIKYEFYYIIACILIQTAEF